MNSKPNETNRLSKKISGLLDDLEEAHAICAAKYGAMMLEAAQSDRRRITAKKDLCITIPK